MSDLSKLLDDVYSSGSSTPEVPSWSSDSALDEAFSDWVPGESEGASAAEQAFADIAEMTEPAQLAVPTETMDQLDALVQAAVAMAPAVDDDELPQENEAAVTESTPVIENEDSVLRWMPERSPEAVEPAAPLPAVAPWNRHDDDILPRRGLGGRRRRMSLRRK
jgi:hypothetical protein